MGKVKTRLLGNEEVEKKQKEEQKKKSAEKKAAVKKSATAEAARPAGGVSAGKAVEQKEKPVKKTKKEETTTPSPKLRRARGKKYQAAKALVDKNKLYPVAEAVSLLKKMALAAFDEAVELHLNVNETGLKGEVELPHSTGKTVRIAVVSDEVLANIEKGKIDFDVLITHPSFMPKLARFAKILGPKGLMPNPKAGTISTNPDEVVKKFAKGILRWKTEPKFPLVHQMIGRKSFEEKVLVANAEKFIQSVGPNRITRMFIKTTMSPAVKLEINKE